MERQISPILIKAKLVQTLENAGFKGAAGAQEGISADFQLFVDIRHFEIAVDPVPSAHVELAAKLVDADGKIIGAKDFDASGPAAGASAAGSRFAVAALAAAHKTGMSTVRGCQEPFKAAVAALKWPLSGECRLEPLCMRALEPHELWMQAFAGMTIPHPHC